LQSKVEKTAKRNLWRLVVRRTLWSEPPREKKGKSTYQTSLHPRRRKKRIFLEGMDQDWNLFEVVGYAADRKRGDPAKIRKALGLKVFGSQDLPWKNESV